MKRRCQCGPPCALYFLALVSILCWVEPARAAQNADRPFAVIWDRPFNTESLNSAYFIDRNTGWAVGERGTIVATRDGGEHWQYQVSGVENTLWSVQFVDASSGWVVGEHGTILITHDGGHRWYRRTSGPDQNLTSAYFSDARNGWVVGEHGTILSTHDGGESWAAQRSGVDKDLLDVHFADALIGWAVGRTGVILATRNGGQLWFSQTSHTSKTLSAVYFAGARNGWSVGDGGTILATRDGGAQWQPQTSGTGVALASVYFVNPRIGWAVGRDGTILGTRLSGAHWLPEAKATTEDLQWVRFTNARVGWAVGRHGTILATPDGGAHWLAQLINTGKDLKDVRFPTAHHGWAVGDDGTILATSDGGKNWQHQVSPSDQPLWGAYFLDARNGWVVGDGGTILATHDGGEHWTAQPSGTTNYLADIRFVDVDDGWVVGEHGTMLVTHNAGERWLSVDTGIQEDFTWVDFPDKRNGWVVGLSGTILVTHDAGKHWTSQISGTQEILTAVHFVNSDTGWAVGLAGTILATHDGGAHWTPQMSGTDQDLTAVHFSNEHTGFAVGLGGTILATRDGGEHWQSQFYGIHSDLWGLDFSNRSAGWIVGDYGILLHAGAPLYAPTIDHQDISIAEELNGTVEVSFLIHQGLDHLPLTATVQYKTGTKPWEPIAAPSTRPATDGWWRFSWNPASYGLAANQNVKYRVTVDDGGPPLRPFELGSFMYQARSAPSWYERFLGWALSHPGESFGGVAVVLVTVLVSTRLLLILFQFDILPIKLIAVAFYLTPFGRWKLFRQYRRAICDDREYRENAARYMDLPYEVNGGAPLSEGLSDAVQKSLRDQNVVVIGEGGRGKSTLCHYIAVRTANGSLRLGQKRTSLFSSSIRRKRLDPVIVEGAAYAGDFIDALTSAMRQHRAYVNKTLVESQLAAGNLFIICDGVSEVRDAYLPSLESAELPPFVRQHSDVRMLITSRSELPTGLRGTKPLQDARTLRLQDIDARAERIFLSRHLKRGEHDVDRVIAEIGLNYPELPRIPLMLRLAANLYDQVGAVPKSRIELFTSYAQELLRAEATGIDEPAGLNFAIRHLVRESHLRTGGDRGMTLNQGVEILTQIKNALEAYDIKQSPIKLLRLLVRAGLYKGSEYLTFFIDSFESFFAAKALELDFKEKRYELLRSSSNNPRLAQTWQLLEELIDPSALRSKVDSLEPLI